jgi:hypothetical protein
MAKLLVPPPVSLHPARLEGAAAAQHKRAPVELSQEQDGANKHVQEYDFHGLKLPFDPITRTGQPSFRLRHIDHSYKRN